METNLIVNQPSPTNTTNQDDQVANNNDFSNDETTTLLIRSVVKPVLMRQDCTTTLSPTPELINASPGLGESNDSCSIVAEQARSVPDIEIHCRNSSSRHSVQSSYLTPSKQVNCVCTHHERRKSHSLARSLSKESLQRFSFSNPPITPPVLLTTSPSSRIIRQSSQPESTHLLCYHSNQHITSSNHGIHNHPHHHHHSGCTNSPVPSMSLRQLRGDSRDQPYDPIAMIASESLRINGAIRQFKQVRA
ncbi:hypothetical protein WDU94_010308 [Cyamophila willieti]